MSKKNVVNFGIIILMFVSGINLFGSSCVTQTQDSQEGGQQFDESDSLAIMVRDGAFLVDVRTVSEYAAGHVKGSVNIPLVTIQDNLQQFEGKGNIVVFCQSGGRSRRAKNILESNGVDHVFNGGGWEEIRAIVGKKR